MPVKPKMTTSMLWQEQQREREYQKHRQRVAEQKACIDDKPPANLSLSNKRTVMEQERNRRIELENRRLVAKMSLIMERGGEIDNKEPWRFPDARRHAENRRGKEQRRLAEENMRILKRLQETKPVYCMEKWAEDRSKNEEYVDRISRYPYVPMDLQRKYL
ncbi:hypothetical protein TRVL_05794 [Trypanosoma vivax]|uniref:Uncharacterized protein n=1 Tax=Trypanosoma vivax (strain Y486) TaxID=1055687 RepID=G0U6U2_TRYVY|nr:hypothetical protein TRVL_05794 [Trypanosoma vivax]CCC51597.1 conserved hypothetical protein [Trypanosoma vivax Y486]